MRTYSEAASPRFARLPAATAAYLAFVVYGSLLPFELSGVSVAEGWRQFLDMPWLELGMYGRADWMANLILYLPLGFLLRAAQRVGPTGLSAATADALAWTGCLAVAVGVEFLQTYLPRTVSLNDLVAEGVGLALGIGVHRLFGDRPLRLLSEVLRRDGRALRAALLLYGLAYLGLSLFPFDFVLSAAELNAKLVAGQAGWLLAPAACESQARCAAKMVAETLAAAPIGLLLAAASGRRCGAGAALLAGFALGAVIESLQLALVSGVSQGLSVVLRGAGVAGGLWIWQRAGTAEPRGLIRRLRLATLAGAPVYLSALAWANGLLSGALRSAPEALETLAAVHWLPFYYHYYSSEAAALASLLAVAAMYAPVGAVIWLWSGGGNRAGALAIWASALLAAVVELSKAAVVGKHPDPTSILIAAAAAGLAWRGARLFGQAAPIPAGSPGRDGVLPGGAGAGAAVFLAGAGAAYAAWHWPAAPAVLTAGLLLYTAALWRYPRLWLLVLPALLPVLDLAPWSGRLLVSEFDLLVVLTVLVAGLRLGPAGAGVRTTGGFRVWLTLFGVSTAVALLRGLLPLDPVDANALAAYFTSYNAVRVAKALVLALAVGWLVARWFGRDPDGTRRSWLVGASTGLAALAGVVLWERGVFPGLLDFRSGYRVSGAFSGVHVGGAQVETYAVLTLPLALVWAARLRDRYRWGVLAGLGAVGLYAIWGTYGRAGWVGLAVALAVLAGFWAVPRTGRAVAAARVFGAAAAISAGALLLAGVGHLGERFDRSVRDADIRFEHWRDVRSLAAQDGWAALLGRGIGTFPRTFLTTHGEGPTPGNFRYVTEEGERYLRLAGDGSLFFGQRVDVRPDRTYLLEFDARAAAGAELNVHLCEKHITESLRCRRARWQPDAVDRWSRVRIPLASGELGEPRNGLRRPVELAFSVGGKGGAVDLDNVELAPGGLIANGDFAEGGDHWFFTSDRHLAWHAMNLWLQLLFDQGWLGVFAFAGLLLVHVLTLLPLALGGDRLAAALLASLAGWLAIGMSHSMLDEPRVMFWFYLLLIYGQLHAAGRAALTRSAATDSVGGAPVPWRSGRVHD